MVRAERMLSLGGYMNILIASAHFIGLGWAKTMFRITGIAKEMVQLKKIHHSLPYLLTITVAILFFIFGLYGWLRPISLENYHC